MEMHQVRYFLAVSELLNFTRAAERCNVAQPSLTRAIKMLEDELGGPLFHRERANTHLSELGRMMLPHLRQVYDQTQEAKQQARDFVKLKVSKLKLGVMCTIPPSHLVDLIGAVQEKHAGVELEIIDSGSLKLEQQLIAGDLEVAIYANPVNPNDERLHYMPLFREPIVVALPESHALARTNGVRPAELNGFPYINRVNCELNGYAGSMWRSAGLDFRIACRSERDDWALAMVEKGFGWTFMPESCVSHRGVVGRPMIDPEFWREVSIVTVRGRPYSPAVGALVREAKAARWAGWGAGGARPVPTDAQTDASRG